LRLVRVTLTAQKAASPPESEVFFTLFLKLGGIFITRCRPFLRQHQSWVIVTSLKEQLRFFSRLPITASRTPKIPGRSVALLRSSVLEKFSPTAVTSSMKAEPACVAVMK